MRIKILPWLVSVLLLALPLVLVVGGNIINHDSARRTWNSSAGAVDGKRTVAVASAGPVNATKPATARKGPAESTQRMARRLREASEGIDIANVFWGANERRVIYFKEKLAKAADWKALLSAEFCLAEAFLQDGQNEECLQELDRLDSLARKNGAKISAKDLQQIRMTRVQAHMRIGEKENCCAEHNEDSCLLPLRGKAIYRHQEGPRMALHLLEEQLAEVPDDGTARWLLNIVYMTKGEYPESVPQQWLINPRVFESEYDIKRFPEIASATGLETYGLSGGAIVDDFDGDGMLDVVRSDMGFSAQMRFFHNNGDGTFTERTDDAGLTGEVGGLNMTSVDYNNDGYLDILVLRGGWLGKGALFPKSLLRNNGDGTFTDVTEEAGLLTARSTQTATWLDYDGDGWLDVFVGCETTDPNFPQLCELFHNNRDGTFTECALDSGIRIMQFVKAVTSGDYNKDGRPDIYISQRDGRPNTLFRNDGPRDPANPKAGWKFTNVTEAAGLAKPIASFPCWFFDYDNDGWPDIFVGGFAGGLEDMVKEYDGQPSKGEHPRLYHNNHDGTFTDVAPTSGLNQTIFGMAGNFGDLDNDGFLDFYVGTGQPSYTALVPKRMFRNDGGQRFQDVTTSGGFGNLQKGHGISFADINNDGQQDIYEVLGGAFTGDKYYSVLYANPGHDGHWVTLKLEGVQTNREAAGAVIRVIVATAQGERSIYRTVTTGGSFGCSPLRQEIGLGPAESIAAIEIFWPVTGKTQRLPGVSMDHFYKIREGDAQAVAWQLPTFRLPVIPVSNLSAR